MVTVVKFWWLKPFHLKILLHTCIQTAPRKVEYRVWVVGPIMKNKGSWIIHIWKVSPKMVTVNHLLFFFIYIWLEFAILIFPYPSISIQIKPVLPEKAPLSLPNRITPVRLAECPVLSLPYIRQRIASFDDAVSYYVLHLLSSWSFCRSLFFVLSHFG